MAENDPRRSLSVDNLKSLLYRGWNETIKRLSEPTSFFKGLKIEFYKDLKDNHNNIRDRWNYPTYQADVKKVLFDATNGECAFCGDKVSENDFDVEQYLPKKFFPYLSYSFENYLCCCKNCNQNLKDYYRNHLKIKEKI